MKIHVYGNDQATLNCVLKTPKSVGNFTILFFHGSTTASTVSFSTEGSEDIYPNDIDLSGDAGDRFMIGVYWDGSAFNFSVSSAMTAQA